MSYKKIKKISGWLVFAIAMFVYYLSAERTGSLWDCGEFITGALKLEVVHPPGAPLFILIGRIFTIFAQLVSDNPETIAFSINLMSGISTAFAAMFITLTTFELGRMLFVRREVMDDQGQILAVAGSAVVAGLTTAFATSIWFSAVEGEVYAMSTFFSALTVWATVHWYTLPDDNYNDRWMIFAVYMASLSIGVHLLSLLVFPVLGILYYLKKYTKHTFIGFGIAGFFGMVALFIIQKVIIVGVPTLWSWFDYIMVNSFGLPFNSGVFPTIIVLGAGIYFGLKYAHKHNKKLIQMLFVSLALGIISFSTVGMVVIRANVQTPINMNNPDNPFSLLPYLNREQYGERPLLYGHHFDSKMVGTETEERYVREGDKYVAAGQKVAYKFKDSDKMFFPRMGHTEQNRPNIHRMWMGLPMDKPLPAGRPNQLDNINFLVKYQLGWMYWRYFMWNFSGRQNGTQGYYPWDLKRGHWLSGIPFVDNARLGDQSILSDRMLNDKARNTYYMLPFIFGLIGLFFHFRKSKKEFYALLVLFLITGIGIIIYSNQPPNEPRERDYVLVGSFFTYAIWVGMGVLGLFHLFRNKVKMSGTVSALVAFAIVVSAPIIMGVQNFDDHDRSEHKGSRDYAANFLESCRPNAVIFTYGDNDTYPLWYAQEVEGIRTDVRVVNLSLIQVDWYIDLLRKKMNQSDPLKLSLEPNAILGKRRNQIPILPQNGDEAVMNLKAALKFVGEDHPNNRVFESALPSRGMVIPVNKELGLKNGIIDKIDTTIVDQMVFHLPKGKRYLIKRDIAVLDIIANNIWERPIYFAITCQQDILMGMGKYLELEGMGLRLVPRVSEGETRSYGMAGFGTVNVDRTYDLLMNKFRYGNFDKVDVFIDRSYAPSIQSHRLIFTRTIEYLKARGDMVRAVNLANKYFESFPNMNFEIEYSAIPILNTLISGDPESAKKYIKILAGNTIAKLDMYIQMDKEILESGYQSDFGMAMRTKDQILAMANRLKDQDFINEMGTLFNAYNVNGGK